MRSKTIQRRLKYVEHESLRVGDDDQAASQGSCRTVSGRALSGVYTAPLGYRTTTQYKKTLTSLPKLAVMSNTVPTSKGTHSATHVFTLINT